MSAAAVLLEALDRKRWTTLQARLALRQYRADLIEDDIGCPLFVITRWAQTVTVSTLDEVATFADRVGAPA